MRGEAVACLCITRARFPASAAAARIPPTPLRGIHVVCSGVDLPVPFPSPWHYFLINPRIPPTVTVSMCTTIPRPPLRANIATGNDPRPSAACGSLNNETTRITPSLQRTITTASGATRPRALMRPLPCVSPSSRTPWVSRCSCAATTVGANVHFAQLFDPKVYAWSQDE